MDYFEVQLSNTVRVLTLKCNKYTKFKGIVYLDRDGVLIEDYGYVGSVENVKLIDGSIDFLKKCQKRQYLVAIITNQSGIGRGYYSWNDYNLVTLEIVQKLDNNIIPHFIIACSKNPEDKASCEDKYRKPQIGMIQYIREQIGVKFDNEHLIGDKASDIECALNANIKSISHVLTGHGMDEAETKQLNYLCKIYSNIKVYESIGAVELN